MTLAGAHWTVSGVTIGVALAAADCDTPASWEQTIGFVTPKPTGALDYSFTWPAALPPVGAPYAICALATGLAPASVPYQVRSALPPTLSLSDAAVAPGQSVTVNGANFIGAPSIDVNLIDPAGARRALGKQTPAADGSFSFSYTPKPADLGLVTVTATSPAEGGALPALAASVTVDVQSALERDRHAASHRHSYLRANQNSRWSSRAFATNPRPARGGDRRADFSAAGAGWLSLRSLLPVARRTPTRGGTGAALCAPAGCPSRRAGLATWNPTRIPPCWPPANISRRAGSPSRAMRMATDWDEDEGPGPDWQPRPMTGSMPIFGDESYPRASDSSDAEQTDAGATVAAEGSSEDSDMLATDGYAPRTVRFRRDRRVSALDNRRSPCALRDR